MGSVMSLIESYVLMANHNIGHSWLRLNHTISRF